MKTRLSMTSKESFAILRNLENQKFPNDGSIELSDWCDQMLNARIEAIKNIVLEVGLGCTICYYSDKRAATVTKIISPCKIEVMFNQTKCLDYFASEYEILSDLEGEPMVFTKRRNGYWAAKGQSCKDGVLLMLHYQNHYIDPTF